MRMLDFSEEGDYIILKMALDLIDAGILSVCY